jgi:predicted neutral ceramidase superfamily lipid hydrolase
MKNRKISPKAYILFIAILFIVTTLGTYIIFDAVNSGNAIGAFAMICAVAVVIVFLIHLVGPKPRDYSYFL